MKRCSGTPAELCALPYLEGTLPEIQVELFEAHFFDCPVCFSYLQDLQAVRGALSQPASGKSQEPVRRGLTKVPVRLWTMAAAVAIVLMAAIVFFPTLYPGPKQPPLPRSVYAAPASDYPANPTPASRPSPLKPAQIADLALPPFVAPNLTGKEDAQFASGMKDYEKGDCRGAVAELARVATPSADLRTARFYCAACEMQLGNLLEAATEMRKVAAAGDSPQQESALYYEAQIALAINNPAAAHRYLVQAIALQGELEQKARNEDRKVQEFFSEQPVESAEKPESLAR
jgi:tetratricopeptide (TPR) repeat protein